MIRVIKNRNFFIMLAVDVGCVSVSLFMAYCLRFDGSIPVAEFMRFLGIVYWVVPLKLFSFFIFGLYRGMWRYTGIEDLKNMTKACLVSSGAVVGILMLTVRFEGFPRSIFPLDFAFTFLFAGGVRVGIRLFFSRREAENREQKSVAPEKRVLIVGAGSAGEKVLREMKENRWLNYSPVGFVDDERSKHGRSVHDVPVLGGLSSINEFVEKKNAQEIIIAIPSASGVRMREIVAQCEKTGILFKTVPGMGELIDGRVSIKALRDVNYQDLLGRPSVRLDVEAVGAYLTNKTVLVTGAGGSIGSELCRQIVRFKPKMVLLLDSCESALYSIQMELKHRVGYLKYRTILGKVQDHMLMDAVFRHYEPHVVFHAAAYKHVPMLERNPWEAVFGNIVGTRTVIEKAVRYDVARMVLVSTDKAVRPTNVMGVSKRIAEMVLQANQGNGTRLMAVRFGNVVGSSGSVIPLFRNQIERGGPVTITHPDVTRFFMTIPEAAQLILEAGALGKGDEIFILEMGTPVKIADMARDLIRLSGKDPDRDIEIVFTGLRPGEKLYEELITQDEGVVKTEHAKIMVLRNNHMWNGYGDQEGYRRWLREGIEELVQLAQKHDGCGIREKLAEMVPEYKAQDSECVL